MISAVQPAHVSSLRRKLSAFIARTSSQLTLLHEVFQRLKSNCPNAYTPDFFCASLDERRWLPQIVVVEDGNETVGLVYAKERKFGGIRTGLIYADSTLGSMLVAHARDREEVFRAALGALLGERGVRGLRILVPPEGFEMAALHDLKSSLSLDFSSRPVENHSVLPLKSSYEEFLEILNPKTRRNFRYFRNRSQAAGHIFVENIPLAEFEKAAWLLLNEDIVGCAREGIDRGLSMFRHAARPLLAGMKTADGEWLSLVGGWYEANRVVVFMQMNSDTKYAKYSLSLVMRSRLIEMLIAQGQHDLLWWAGVGAPISHYVKQIPTNWVYIDKRSFAWRSFRRVLAGNRKLVPAAMAETLNWIIPAVETAGGSSRDIKPMLADSGE